MDRTQKLIFYSQFFDAGGYALLARGYTRGLLTRGWPIRVEVMRGPVEIDNENVEFFNKLRHYDEMGRPSAIMEPNLIKIISFIPVINNIPKFKHNIIYTMMECRKVHPSFIENCNRYYHSCWTPTEFNAQVFRECGMKIPVSVAPIGIDDIFSRKNIDPDYKPNYKLFGEGPVEPSGFKFMSMFRWSYRKGFDVLIKSFLREFEKKDNVSLTIYSRHASQSHEKRFNDAVEYDIFRLIEENKKPNMPPIYWSSQITPIDKMPTLYGLGDAFISTSRGEGQCTLPDAKIKTLDGIKEIQNIKVGDYVFTHKGRPKKVLNVIKRNYFGEMVKIRCYGRANIDLILTPNHPVYTLKTSKIKSTQTKNKIFNSEFDKNSLQFVYRNSYGNRSVFDKINLEWIEASDISIGDNIFYPKINYEDKKEYIDLKNELKNENFIFENNKIFYANKFGRKCNTYSFLDFYKLKFTKELFRLFGYFIAEGSTNGANICFAFHSNEIKYIDDVKCLFKFCFNKCKPNLIFRERHSAQLTFANKMISKLFINFFGRGAKNKKIPYWFFNIDDELKFSLLSGMFKGDGCFGERCNHKMFYSTSSLELANNVFDLLHSLGIGCSINIDDKEKRKKDKAFENSGIGYVVNITSIKNHNALMSSIGEEYFLKNGRHFENYKTTKDYQLLKVRKIEKVNYSGLVYNIAVEEDNSYICENLAVHNCLPSLEAGKMEIPTILPYHSGFMDYVSDQVSYKIDVDEWEICNENLEWKKGGWITNLFLNQEFPKFGDQTVEQVRSLMRRVLEQPTEAANKVKEFKKLIDERYSWDACLDAAESHLDKVIESF